MRKRPGLAVLGLAVLGALLLLGCSSQETPQVEPQRAHTEMGHGESQSRKAETELEDPVCGMSVSASSEHTAAHGGSTYYFCSPGCRGKFVEDPQKYLNQ